MDRRTFLADLCRAAAGATLLGAGQGLAAPSRKKLNVVFFLIDDLGWTDVSCYGSRFYETPNVDRLAKMGVRFTNGYAACTVCSPTRASIMTGKYPARLHLTDWIAGYKPPYAKLRSPDWNMRLEHSEVTLAEALKADGYKTGFIGKWHLGPEGYWPDSQGFDVNIGGFWRGSPPSYFAPYRIPTMREGPKGEYLTDRHAADAEAYIDANAADPFFLYISMYAVHTPIQGKKELTERYKAKAAKMGDYPQKNPTYAAMVQSMDECVGRVLKKLEDKKLVGSTAIFFLGDNGGQCLRNITRQIGIRAGKGSAYEGGVRVPFLAYCPSVTTPQSVSDEPVISNDFYPTILELVGAQGDPKHNETVDGTSLLPVLRSPSAKLDRGELYWHYPHYHPGGATPYGAIRARDWKLIEFYEDMHVELYNLREDQEEKHDRAAEQPDRAKALRARLQAWRKAIDAQMPVPNPSYDPEIGPWSKKRPAKKPKATGK